MELVGSHNTEITQVLNHQHPLTFQIKNKMRSFAYMMAKSVMVDRMVTVVLFTVII